MEDPNGVYEEIITSFQKLEAVPEQMHLFCPQIDDDDGTDYECLGPEDSGLSADERASRLESAKDRLDFSVSASLVLAISKDQASEWFDKWIERAETYLKSCAFCIRLWHKVRKPFLQKLADKFNEDTAAIMSTKLNAFDKARIDLGLGAAEKILRKNGPMKTNALAKRDETAVLALYEALCCMPYLSLPDNRATFNYVFQEIQKVKKPLRLGSGVIPTMTHFLFQEDELRSGFAKAAWESIPPESLKPDQFDWAVNEYLASEMEAVAHQTTDQARVKRFWEGLAVLLPAMSEEFVLHTLRGMQIQPDIYHLAFNHLAIIDDPNVLATLIRTFCALMQKSTKAFWSALSDLSPAILTQHIWACRAFMGLLARSLEPGMLMPEGEGEMPLLSYFVKNLMDSLQPTGRSDACDSILHQLLDTFKASHETTRDAKAVCANASLVALTCTLEGLKDPKLAFSTALVYIDITYNIVLKYKDFLIDCVSLKSGDRYNIGLSAKALHVIKLALTLDAETFSNESKAIKAAQSYNRVVERRSSQLWDAFIDHMQPSKTTGLANVIIIATKDLQGVERFLPGKKEVVVKDEKKAKFNKQFEATAESIGRLIGRVSVFTPHELQGLCSDAEALGALVGCLVHGEESISLAAVDFIKSLTGEDSRSDALEKMIGSHTRLFLWSFSDAVAKKIPPADPKLSAEMFGPVPNMLRWYQDILEALCNSTTGLLRSREMTKPEGEAVKYWWRRQWIFLGYFFGQTKAWSEKYVSKKDMEDCCTQAVLHADALLAEDGLIANAISVTTGHGDGPKALNDARVAAMKVVLDQPRVMTTQYTQMLQLRDQELLAVFARSVGKLLRRLREFDMALPNKPLQMLKDICIRQPDGRYKMNSNLRPPQKAELLRALGTDLGDESDSSGPPVLKPVAKAQPKKQSSLDTWSKTAPSTDSAHSSKTTSTAASTSSLSRPSAVKGESVAVEKAPSILSTIKAQSQAPRKPSVLSTAAIKATQLSIREARQKQQQERTKANAAARARAEALREAAASGKMVGGDGYGLKGIAGVLDKTHAPAKSETFVGSDEEDEDDDSDGDEEMADILKDGQAGKDASARRLRELKAKQLGPVKKTKIQRSKKDLRARITPPMERLHEAILEWDIFHEGNDPPNGYSCREVAKSYLSPVDYRDTFFPLLVNEAWRSFVTSKDESTSKPFDIKIINRVSVDKFMEVTTSIPMPNLKDKDRERLSDGDIILLSSANEPLSDRDAPHSLARVFKTMMKKSIIEVTCRLISKGNGRFLQALMPGADLRGLRITNMTTVEREFAALESLQYYDLMTEVLEAEPSPVLTFSDERVQSFQDNYQLNKGQASAIINAKENDGFTLVQGPPGTGKTKTIIAMVGALLTGNIKINKPPPVPVRPGVNGEAPMARKLLVCAPSNAAVDELVLRLKAGIKDTNGQMHKINVLRLGRSDAVNQAVKDVTLDELVKEKMDALAGQNAGQPSDREKMHQEAGEIKAKMMPLRAALESARESNDIGQLNNLQREFDVLKRRQMQLGSMIDREKSSGNTYAREAEVKRRGIQQSILADAHVLCATLSGSGHDMFKTLQVEFETVIIDEAAQCVELSALIPLKYGASKCVLVGDPKQLPPTVLSQSAARYGYDQSLFVRMQQNHPTKVHLLDCQYRMHPEISLFPSKEFYEGRLADGDDMAKLRQQPWHENPLLGPYRFFDVEGIQERGNRGQSLVNTNEVSVALQIFNRFSTDFSSRCGDLKGKIGIITPYKAQLHALRQRFLDRYGEAVLEQIEFNTTDAFQGRECEIIIFSCVRASPTGGIGFMTDIRRMNVGLTRARSSLWVLGDSRALKQGPFWAKLIEDAKARDRYTSGSIMAQLRSAATSRPMPMGAVPMQAPSSNGPPTMQRRDSERSDIEMLDVNDARARAAQSLPTNDGTHQTQGQGHAGMTGPPPRALSSAPPIQSSAGRNARSMASSPVIQSSAPRGPAGDTVIASRKRPAQEDGGDMSSTAKRSATNPHHQPQHGGASARPPSAPKAMPSRPPQRPTDPSAMQALGMVPPDRPAAPRPPRPPKKKGPADPFLQRGRR
ncbi:DNA-binding protein SMUBP-2 [Gaeumannomyces tritici R3-111a-1]|uniref:DNA-binding protein SMUBP-2 n=1 Tax=Gaeumannomyces tritici (strain R3-111a-1) TaxID=644352 RepID=J3PDU1_GAET3|nr:DNA-binding protein SMUBP-2 [Gaeumannomyces tritici R3-111a-1]EJT70641.1 DNA-binding protein SMUBP-2 [Gaeumannomyces tritici R3-111a-1]